MRYSVSTTTDFDKAILDPQIGCWYMRQNVVAFQGLCQVRAERTPFYGGDESRPYRSQILLNPTWRQLFAVAKKQQQATKDLHHDFFEGYHDTKKDDMMLHPHHLPVRVLKLNLGS